MKLIDDFLNKTTMYRLTFYYLIGLVLAAVVFSFLGLLSFTPWVLMISVFFLLACCWLANALFAKAFKVPANLESVYISALILALIIKPAGGISDLFFLFWVSVSAMASKYILVWKNNHLFNPVALAVFLASLFLHQSANWWVGTQLMLPLVFFGGLLVIRKTQKETPAVSFLTTAVLTILVSSLLKVNNFILLFKELITETPFFFFVFVMLTEPLTMPAGKKMQIAYGGLVGLGLYFLPPETALLAGNVFSSMVNPKIKLTLKLKEKKQIAPFIYDFIFTKGKKLNFLPGQYLEWTLRCADFDSRGNRRYFTLSSSSTEEEIRIGVRFSEKPSVFKKSMLGMGKGDEIVASRVAGEFILPKNEQVKLIFIAGGIGITPFRSMIKFLIDKKQKRDIIMFYTNQTENEIVYRDVFEEAKKLLGLKTIYIVTEKMGRLNSEMIKKEAPDYLQRFYLLSGPRSLVTSFQDVLEKMGVQKSQIKTDFFPGFV